MNKKNYLNDISNSRKPFIIYKTNKGFDLFTDFSKKIILNNQNIRQFLKQRNISKKKYQSTDLFIGFFGYELLNNLIGVKIPSQKSIKYPDVNVPAILNKPIIDKIVTVHHSGNPLSLI